MTAPAVESAASVESPSAKTASMEPALPKVMPIQVVPSSVIPSANDDIIVRPEVTIVIARISTRVSVVIVRSVISVVIPLEISRRGTPGQR